MSACPPRHIVDFAVESSRNSPCRSKRGVAIFRADNLLSQGHNFKPHAFACDGSDACKATCRREAIHAEQMALLLLGGLRADGSDMLHVKTVAGALVPSGGPSCVECSKLALVSGIKGFWLYHEDGWRRYDMEEFHTLSLQADASRVSRQEQEQEQEKETRVAPLTAGVGGQDLPQTGHDV